MQDVLNLAFEFTAIVSIAYITVAFTGFIMGKKRRTSPGQLELPLFDDADIAAVAEEMSQDDRPISTDAIAPFRRPDAGFLAELLAIGGDAPAPAPAPQEFTIRQLKALASLYQVPRFNKLSKAKLGPIVLEAIAS